MNIVKIVGFKDAQSIGFGNENRHEKPQSLNWDFSPPENGDVVVFADNQIRNHKQCPAKKRIALLHESPEIRPDLYDWVMGHYHEFDVIFTHQRVLVEAGRPFLFYPLGGSWIHQWGVFPKSKMTSILVSGKTRTMGHRLRHEAAKLPGIDAYGNGVGNRVPNKAEALRDYRFVVVIENCISDAYFSEKLVDAISQGCVPIYRGCPDIGRFFSPYGIITWETLDELRAIVSSLQAEDYENYKPYISLNLQKAWQYRCPEDWIVDTYPGIFDG